METKIFENYEEFSNREDERINGVTLDFLEENNIDLESLNLANCEKCFNCKNCENCENCYNCDNFKNSSNLIKI